MAYILLCRARLQDCMQSMPMCGYSCHSVKRCRLCVYVYVHMAYCTVNWPAWLQRAPTWDTLAQTHPEARRLGHLLHCSREASHISCKGNVTSDNHFGNEQSRPSLLHSHCTHTSGNKGVHNIAYNLQWRLDHWACVHCGQAVWHGKAHWPQHDQPIQSRQCAWHRPAARATMADTMSRRVSVACARLACLKREKVRARWCVCLLLPTLSRRRFPLWGTRK